MYQTPIKDIKWIPGRIEIIVSHNDVDKVSTHSATYLEKIHRQLYTELDLREEELQIVTKYEILVASPGVSDDIQTDQEYASFRGMYLNLIPPLVHILPSLIPLYIT